jgi:hypothetical protein
VPLGPPDLPKATNRLQDSHHTYEASYTAPFSNRLLLELGGNRFDNTPQDLAFQPGQGPRPINDIGKGFIYGAVSQIRYSGQTDHFRGSLSYVSGTHALKVGGEARFSEHNPFTTKTPGDTSYVLLNGKPSSVTFFTGRLTYYNRMRPNLGMYAQDRWTLKRLTADVGLRFDYVRTSYPAESLPAEQYRPQPISFSGATVLGWKDIDPRLGIAYDLFGTGKTAIKGNVARYVNQQVLAITRTVNPIATSQMSTTRSWTDNGDFIIQGDPLNPLANGELGPGSNKSFGAPVVQLQMDPDFAKGFGVRPYIWEMSAGVQHELLPGVALTGMYYRKLYGNFQVTQNRAVSPSDYSPYSVTAPSDPRLPNGGNYLITGLYDLNPNKVGQTDNLLTSSEKCGSQIRHWNGVDLLVNARVGKGASLALKSRPAARL